MRGMNNSQQKPDYSARKLKNGKKVALFGFAAILCFLAAVAPAQDDPVKIIEAKRVELKEKEEALKRDEARIETYTRLLAQMETVLKRLEQAKGDKIENVVKAYEVMPPEDAAVRISALDNDTALRIMTRMKSKKAGAIMAVMEPGKAAALTRRLATIASNKSRQ
jgi:flagellar motility protein MotE (MotC chaperone)